MTQAKPSNRKPIPIPMPMPCRFNKSQRHTIKKALYKVTNWAEYSDALRNRRNITIWLTLDAVDDWQTAKIWCRGQSVQTGLAHPPDTKLATPGHKTAALGVQIIVKV